VRDVAAEPTVLGYVVAIVASVRRPPTGHRWLHNPNSATALGSSRDISTGAL